MSLLYRLYSTFWHSGGVVWFRQTLLCSCAKKCSGHAMLLKSSCERRLIAASESATVEMKHADQWVSTRAATKALSLTQLNGMLCGTLLACLLSFFIVACSDSTGGTPSSSGSTGGNTSAPQVTPEPATLDSLHWCGKPAMVFRDQADPNAAKLGAATKLGPANGTPTAINDWNTVKDNLGFTVFLPKTLPGGSCLLSVSGSLRDPIFGSNFTITYVLPDQNSISFSQAPSRSQNTGFQCNVSDALAGNGTAEKKSTPTTTTNLTQLCNGVRDKTNIVFSARGATPALEQFFQSLQPNVDWMPAR